MKFINVDHPCRQQQLCQLLTSCSQFPHIFFSLSLSVCLFSFISRLLAVQFLRPCSPPSHPSTSSSFVPFNHLFFIFFPSPQFGLSGWPVIHTRSFSCLFFEEYFVRFCLCDVSSSRRFIHLTFHNRSSIIYCTHTSVSSCWSSLTRYIYISLIFLLP